MTEETGRSESSAPGGAGVGLGRVALFSLRFLIVVAAIVVLGRVVERLQIVIVPVLLAVLGVVPLVPLRRRLEHAGLPRRAASALVFVGALAVLVGVVAFSTPGLADELGSLDTAIVDGLRQVRDWLVEGPVSLSPESVDQVVDHVAQFLEANIATLAAGATTAIGVITGAFMTLLIAAFFLAGGERMWAWSVRMLPDRHRSATDAAGRRAWHVLSNYIAGSAINGAIEAAVIGVALVVLDVPLVVPLMALTFIAPFFPVVGAIAAGAVAILVALVSHGWVTALIVGLVYLGVQQLESNILAPFVLGRAVRLHPVVVALAMLAGGSVGGIVGAFFAAPLVAVTWGVLQELVERGIIESSADVDALLHGQAADSVQDDVSRE